ncbi:hypothetical protein SAMN06295888_11740 [Desulfonatronum zhilinae]|nr:hypothetical protein SAMN06295888_11740 [Desulfonatronum zhilinae]
MDPLAFSLHMIHTGQVQALGMMPLGLECWASRVNALLFSRPYQLQQPVFILHLLPPLQPNVK